MAGVRVVEVSHYVAGPMIGRTMADLGAAVTKIELAKHGDQLVLQPWVLDRDLLDLDDQADLADRELDDLLQQGDVFAFAGVEPAQLRGGVIAHEAGAVGGPIERVVVDDHQPAVGGEVDVAFDEVAAGADR